jgi:hypothetical protein
MLEIAQFIKNHDVDYCEPFHTGKNPSQDYETDYTDFTEKLQKIKNAKTVLIKDIGNLFWYISQQEHHFERFKELDREYRNYIDTNFYTVYIDRQNLFDVVLSFAIASETGKWHRKRFDWYAELQQQRKYVEQFCDFDKIVEYDTLTSNPKQDLKAVFDFELDSNKKSSTVANASKDTTVKNYTELKQLYTKLGANNE